MLLTTNHTWAELSSVPENREGVAHYIWDDYFTFNKLHIFSIVQGVNWFVRGFTFGRKCVWNIDDS